MQFTDGAIDGIIWKPLKKHHDARGWLCELFRLDELPEQFHPQMAYISTSEPGVVRGPHAHHEQADGFCFLGPSDFLLALWDDRPESPTYCVHEKRIVGESAPTMIVIPPGVVHGYKNIGAETGVVFNCPNRLYQGAGRRQPVDEIRYEEDADSPFRFDSGES